MEVLSVVADDVQIEGEHGWAVSTLFTFARPQWVSVHHERGRSAVGPMSLVEDETGAPGTIPSVKAKHFGPRKLHVEPGTQQAVHYRETWTLPENSLYALVLPVGHVADVQIDREEAGRTYQPAVSIAVTPDQRIFHFATLMGDRPLIHVRARIRADAAAHQRVCESGEVSSGTHWYTNLGQGVQRDAGNSDFWFKLLSLGSKLLGGP